MELLNAALDAAPTSQPKRDDISKQDDISLLFEDEDDLLNEFEEILKWNTGPWLDDNQSRDLNNVFLLEDEDDLLNEFEEILKWDEWRESGITKLADCFTVRALAWQLFVFMFLSATVRMDDTSHVT